MTTPSAAERPAIARKRASSFGTLMPRGLYTRSLLIVILPIILLQSIVALVFMERHWQATTRRLSTSVAQEISALVDMRRSGIELPVVQRAASQMGMSLSVEPGGTLPVPRPPPMFFILERVLSDALATQVDYPFWVDAQDRSRGVDIRVKTGRDVMRFTAPVSRAYASNSHIFLVWMVSASLLLITVAILFLRNQIRPILQLASVAEDLGRGRPVADFKPRGAQEVRRATQAFFAMRDRIERQIVQRTTMLAGVSHDLRTVLTRLRLQLALLPQSGEVDDLVADVNEMERMLEGYLAFARGDAGETARRIDAAALLDEIAADARRSGVAISASFTGNPSVVARADALKRAIGNLVMNAARFARKVEVRGRHDKGQLVVAVDDDGPGIPRNQLDEVFRPFLRLDEARNLDHPGSGLGLTIARDIARGHGGDVVLSKSALGGLRAELYIPA